MKTRKRAIDSFLQTKLKIFGWEMQTIDFLFALILICIGIFARLSLFRIVSGDYHDAFADWMRECRQAGGWGYIAIDRHLHPELSTFDYNCMFQYVICFLNMFHGILPDMHLVKLFSVIFDIAGAITAMRIGYHLSGGNVHKAMGALAAVLVLPSAIQNSAAWAQNDSIYACFVLLSFLSLIRGKDFRTFLYFAIAFTFKQQAVFFLPFLLIAWLLGKVKIRYILVVPVFYVLSMIPAVLLGRSLSSLLGVYGSQVNMFTRLSMNYPSIYAIIPDGISRDLRQVLIPAGILVTIMLLGIVAYYTYIKNFRITPLYLITAAVFTAQLTTFCLPVMHERYGYIAGILAFIYGLFGYRRFLTAVGFEALTLCTYARYLYGSTVRDVYPLSAIMLVLILVVGYDLYRQMQIPPEERPEGPLPEKETSFSSRTDREVEEEEISRSQVIIPEYTGADSFAGAKVSDSVREKEAETTGRIARTFQPDAVKQVDEKAAGDSAAAKESAERAPAFSRADLPEEALSEEEDGVVPRMSDLFGEEYNTDTDLISDEEEASGQTLTRGQGDTGTDQDRMKPAVSVIVPAYNTVHFLRRCVESICAQQMPEEQLEVLIVDDGSTDGTGELADTLSREHSNVRVIHQANGGSSRARNAGLREARGSYIGFVDSDDYVSPRMYVRLLSAARQTGADITQISRVEVAEDGRRLPDVVTPPKRPVAVTGQTFLKLLLLHRGDASFCTKLTRRELFTHQLQFPEGRLNEDFNLLLRMMRAVKKIVILPQRGYCVYYRSGSNSRKAAGSDKNAFPSVYKDIVTNADLAEKVVARYFPLLRVEARRFALYQRLEYLLHIPTSKMTKSNRFYRNVVVYIRRHIADITANPYLTGKQKTDLIALSSAPRQVREIHAKMKGL